MDTGQDLYLDTCGRCGGHVTSWLSTRVLTPPWPGVQHVARVTVTWARVRTTWLHRHSACSRLPGSDLVQGSGDGDPLPRDTCDHLTRLLAPASLTWQVQVASWPGHRMSRLSPRSLLTSWSGPGHSAPGMSL